MPDKFELVECDFGKDVMGDMTWFVEQQLETLLQAHQELHMQKLPKWRRLYLGRPLTETKNSPWMNAANTVVQVIGETVDTMVARVMGLVWATHPLWTFQNFAKADTDEAKEANESERRVLEEFMDLVGVEPDELNLHEVEALWYTEAANLGTAFVKVALEQNTEAVVVGYDSEADKRIRGTENTIYAGPKVYNLRHEDLLADAKAQTLEKADFVAVKRTLSRMQLEERSFKGDYKKDAVKEIIDQPDRSQPIEPVRQELQDQGVTSPSRPDTTAEWDIWECYFPRWFKGRKYRIILTFHKHTKTVLRCVFSFMPENALPVKRAKLGYRTNGLYGHGYAELLEIYQEELSTTHNQRLDNATIANIRALRVSPKARTLDANQELYPSALLVGEKDDIEAIQIGDVYPSTFKNEEMTLQLVARRAGITPAVAGAGSGSMMKRPQQYSAQGTLAVMQENNTSVGWATSEFRHAHTCLGSLLVKMYGKFGTFGREEAFGLDGERLEAALDKFEQHSLRIPIRASTGSMNREVEKQTGMLLAGLLQRHYTAVGQLIQAVSNPMAGPEFKQYAQSVIFSSTMFHRKVVKDFGFDPELYVPDAPDEGAGQAGQMAPGGLPVSGAGPSSAPGGGVNLPRGDVGLGLSGLAPSSR
jgi:hypothetical protein